MHRAFWLTAGGTLIAWAAMLSYFTIVPRWPDLRDSGLLNVVLAWIGVALGAWALAGVFRGGSMRFPALAIFGLGALAAAFLTVYIAILSYQLPGPEGVVEPGTAAPPIALPDQDGVTRTLEEFRGKKVVLVFFRGHW